MPEPDAVHPRPPVRHPAGGAGLRAHGFDDSDPASVAAAVFAGIVPDRDGRTYAMAAARRGRRARPKGTPDA